MPVERQSDKGEMDSLAAIPQAPIGFSLLNSEIPLLILERSATSLCCFNVGKRHNARESSRDTKRYKRINCIICANAQMQTCARLLRTSLFPYMILYIISVFIFVSSYFYIRIFYYIRLVIYSLHYSLHYQYRLNTVLYLPSLRY